VIPLAPILIGLAVGYVANRILTPSNVKDKTDAKVRTNDRNGDRGDFDCEQNPASNEDHRERLIPGDSVEENDPAKTDPETPTQDTPDEVSPHRQAISDLRSDQPCSDLPSEQLPDAEKPSSTESE